MFVNLSASIVKTNCFEFSLWAVPLYRPLQAEFHLKTTIYSRDVVQVSLFRKKDVFTVEKERKKYIYFRTQWLKSQVHIINRLRQLWIRKAHIIQLCERTLQMRSHYIYILSLRPSLCICVVWYPEGRFRCEVSFARDG